MVMVPPQDLEMRASLTQGNASILSDEDELSTSSRGLPFCMPATFLTSPSSSSDTPSITISSTSKSELLDRKYPPTPRERTATMRRSTLRRRRPLARITSILRD